MARIILTPEQVHAIQDADGDVELIDVAGNLVGFVRLLFTRQEIDEAKRCAESNEERRTTAQVLERIRSLDKQDT